MSWEHELAREFRGRDNRTDPAWFRGEVLSPIRREQGGQTIYEGPLIISCYDGQVMLRSDQLQMLAGVPSAAGSPRLYKGISVALTGNLFSGDAGSLKILILGVVQNAV